MNVLSDDNNIANSFELEQQDLTMALQLPWSNLSILYSLITTVTDYKLVLIDGEEKTYSQFDYFP